MVGHAVASLFCDHTPPIDRITIASEMHWSFGYVKFADPAHKSGAPFRPFDIRLSDGQSIRVDHPEWAVPSPSKRTVVVFGPGEEDEQFRIIDLLHVTTLETVNGTRRGRKARDGR